MKSLSITRLVLAAAVTLGAVTGSRAGLTAEQAGRFVRDFYAVYNATGAPKMAEFYTADATFTDPTFGLELQGRDRIGQLFTTVLAKYESLEHEVSHTILAGDELVVEGTMIGRLAGKTMRVRFTSIFHFTDGKISAQRDMFDVLHFYAQLGIVPPEFRAKTAIESNAKS
jgi:ketosteroid isomerase-like protein